MKKFLLLGLLVSFTAFGAGLSTNAPPPQLTLAWDRSPADLITNGVTYSIYGSQVVGGVTNYLTSTGILTNRASFDGIPGGAWKFYATARQTNVESLPSNLLTLQVPAAPAALVVTNGP